MPDHKPIRLLQRWHAIVDTEHGDTLAMNVPGGVLVRFGRNMASFQGIRPAVSMTLVPGAAVAHRLVRLGETVSIEFGLVDAGALDRRHVKYEGWVSSDEPLPELPAESEPTS